MRARIAVRPASVSIAKPRRTPRARSSRVQKPIAAPAGRRATTRSITVVLPIPGRPVMRRFSVAATIVPGPGWDAVLGRLAGDTVMVVGAADCGKSHLTRYLLEQAAVTRAAVVSADMGQPSIGVPACLAM